MVSEIVTQIIIPKEDFFEEFHEEVSLVQLNPVCYRVLNVIDIREATILIESHNGVKEFQYRVCAVAYDPDTRKTVVCAMEDCKIFKTKKIYGRRHGASDRTGQAKEKK